jgi:Peptidase M15.
MQLTNNFSLKELTTSETATRKGLDNTPNEAVTANLKTLAENILQPVREHYGKSVKVNSGYRSPEVNASVGGLRLQTTAKVKQRTSRLLVLLTVT